MSSFARKAKWEKLRKLAFGSMSTSHIGIGTPLTQPIKKLFLHNYTDALAIFSMDGLDDYMPLLPGQVCSVDMDEVIQEQCTRFYARYTATDVPTEGSVYVSSIGTSIAG